MSLLPEGSRRILDVGCGEGLTADLVREREPGAYIVGVEPDPLLASKARSRVDRLIEGGIDSPEILSKVLDLGPFDAVLCADVLEHLPEPQTVLDSLVAALAKGGCVITSLPNVRHISTFLSLGVAGNWPARDRGIHDRTHLRFFARRNALEMGQRAGLRLLRERRNVRLIESRSWTMLLAKPLDFWPFRPFVTFQYLHLWVRRSDDT